MQTVSQTVGQLERGFKQMIPAEQEPLVDEGKAIIKRYANMPFGMRMETEITKAKNVLKALRDFPAFMDRKLVSSQIKQADALLFVTTFRAGIFMTGHFGSGLVIARTPDGSWSAPSAVNFFGTGLGLQMGMDITDYVIILKKAAIDNFIGTNQMVLGGDAGLTIGLGRHGTADLHLGQTAAVTIGWAQSKGWFAGASAQAGLIHTRRETNKKFYGRDVEAVDLLKGKHPKPRAAKPLYDALADLP